MGRNRENYLNAKNNYYSRKLSRRVNQQFKQKGTNIVNRLYQVNGNNRVFKNRYYTKSMKFEASLQKQLYKEISKPNGITFQISFNTHKNTDILLFNTDSYFTFNDFTLDETTKTNLDTETVINGAQTYNELDSVIRYKENLKSMLPGLNEINSLKAAKVADSVLNPSFYPQSIIVNPTIAAVCWGWIFRVNPNMLRFDYSLYSFYSKLFNYIRVTEFTKVVPLLNTADGLAMGANATMEKFKNSRRYRMLIAHHYYTYITSPTKPKHPMPVPEDILDDNVLNNSLVMERVETFFKTAISLAAVDQAAIVGLNIVNLLGQRNGQAPGNVLIGTFGNSYATIVTAYRNLQGAALNLSESELCWKAIFAFNSQAVYFLLFYLDMLAYCLKYARHPPANNAQLGDLAEDNETFPVLTSFLQQNKFLTGRNSVPEIEDQYYYTYSDLLSNGFLKCYPCNMMVGKDWKIKSRKANSVVFFVPNDDVKQTVNFIYSVNVSLYSFKKFILESADSKRFDSLATPLKEYVKKMLPNIEKFFIVKDANAKIIKDRLDRMLNTINRR